MTSNLPLIAAVLTMQLDSSRLDSPSRSLTYICTYVYSHTLPLSHSPTHSLFVPDCACHVLQVFVPAAGTTQGPPLLALASRRRSCFCPAGIFYGQLRVKVRVGVWSESESRSWSALLSAVQSQSDAQSVFSCE